VPLGSGATGGIGGQVGEAPVMAGGEPTSPDAANDLFGIGLGLAGEPQPEAAIRSSAASASARARGRVPKNLSPSPHRP
jgi:hypothetical protein